MHFSAQMSEGWLIVTSFKQNLGFQGHTDVSKGFKGFIAFKRVDLFCQERLTHEMPKCFKLTTTISQTVKIEHQAI